MAINQQINRFIHSRWFFIVMAFVTVAGARVAYVLGDANYISGNRGIIFPSANLWFDNHNLEMWVNVLATVLIGVGMITLNRVYNMLRTTSMLDAALFMVMSLASPGLIVQVFTGTPLCLVVLLCLYMLYGCYSNPGSMRVIYLIFVILSGMTMTQYCYAVYIPVFILGCAQMRIMTWRTLAAAVMGIITPWWVVLGSGLVPLDGVHAPDFESLFVGIGRNDTLHMVFVVVFTAAVLVVGWCLNFTRMIAYNAHMRSMTGVISVISLFTLIAIVADFNNVCAYAPLLNVCASLQIGRMFAGRNDRLAYLPVLTLFAVYFAIYAWRIAI